MARQQLTIDTRTPSSCTGSGPTYNVDYSTNHSGIQVGDWVSVNHEEAGNDGNILFL